MNFHTLITKDRKSHVSPNNSKNNVLIVDYVNIVYATCQSKESLNNML